MKIAMLVHNPVVEDARVRKEAWSLANAGFHVDVFGYGDPTLAPSEIENCKLKIVEKKKIIRLLNSIRKLNFSQINKYKKIIFVFLNLITGYFLSWMMFDIQVNGLDTSSIFRLPFLILMIINFVYFFIFYKIKILEFITLLLLIFVVFLLLFLRLEEIYLFIIIASKVWSLETYLTAHIYFLLLTTTTIVFYLLFKIARFIVKNFIKDIFTTYGVAAAHEYIAKQLVKNIDIKKYDVVHAHDIIALIAAVKLKKKKKELKIIWDAHELYIELGYKDENTKSFMYETIAKSSDKIDYFVTINETFIDYYQSKFPNLPSATVLMNAARSAKLEHFEESPLRKAAGISKKQFVLLFQGGFSFNRGVEILLNVAEKMPKSWSIIFMGKGPLYEKIVDKIKELKGTRPKGRDAIALIPPAPYQKLTQWTAGADLGAIPYENVNLNHLYCTPNKLWEYPNAGVPILGSGMVEIKKMIDKYETGLILPKNFTSQDIVDVLEKVDRSKLNQLVKNCHKFNEVEHWEKYEKKLVELYKNISL